MEANDGMDERGRKIWAVKQEYGSQIRSNRGTLLLAIYLGGKFEFVKYRTEYVGGSIYMKEGVGLGELTMVRMREIVKAAQRSSGLLVHDWFSMWHRVAGRNLTNGRKKIENDSDFQSLYGSKDMHDRVVVYVVDEPRPQMSGPPFRSKTLSVGGSSSRPIPQINKVVWPMSKPNTQPIPQSLVLPNLGPRPPLSQPILHAKEPTTYSIPPSFSQPTSKSKHTAIPIPSISQSTEATKLTNLGSVRRSPRLPEVQILGTSSNPPKLQTQASQNINPSTINLSPSPTPPASVEKRATPRVKHVARKPAKKGKEVEKVVKKKEKAKKKLFSEGADSGEGEGSEAELSDFEYFPGEEDRREDIDDELFFNSALSREDLSRLVEQDLEHIRGGRSKGKEKVQEQPRWVEEEWATQNREEEDCDSDEVRSLNDSDEEFEQFPTFRPETDLKGQVNLSLGLKFDSIYDIRKAVQHHSIHNRYNYYFQHNGSGRFEVYCRHKCDCSWNPKKCKIMWCTCSSEEMKCSFKVKARQIPMSDEYQIRGLHLEHECGFFHASNKVTSGYLAEKYLDDWKSDPSWKLKAFIERVYRDTGIKIGYYKAWFTRCRVKQILYGDAADQYGKVYQYAFAILIYNPGSTAIVCTENAEHTSTPSFSRMYVCLEACKTGYKQGCRPIIGIDGCHLKGQYPGMLLAAVGKDGNNNIFPIAWTIVEIENTSTWTWFLELLLADTGHNEGEGVTLMSDRQKGLLEAMSIVAPKADIRFCVRHIWANFKLKFGGTIFKEFFWRAAKATTLQQFEKELGSIRFLSEEAYNYLEAIPAKHWSRHAFTTTAKSNMVTNNICETFNAVIREARDKPVITCLEWIRRYIMKRHAEKWDGVQSYGGRFMPYTGRVLGWIMEGAKNCFPTHSRVDEWEVDTTNDRFVVNLRTNTCTCNHFMLTGIPCSHAWACIVAKREKPEQWVHEYYTKEVYMKAYSSHIKPMPGFKHWDPCSMPEPLPPPFKTMPGRPGLKNRKKEAGEEEEGRAKKLKKMGGKQKCSNCGEFGHKKVKCKKPVVPKPQAKKGGRPPSNDPWVAACRKKKEKRAKLMPFVPPSQSSQTMSNRETEYAPPSQSSCISASQTGHAPTAPSATYTTSHPPVAAAAYNDRKKLVVKPSKKKIKSLNHDLFPPQQ